VIAMTRTNVRAARAVVSTALVAVLALAGCEAQPVGTFDPARYVADPGGQAYSYVAFRPGSAELAPGEQERLSSFLQGQPLGPRDEILLRLAPSGSQILDSQRTTTLQGALAGARAPVQVASAGGPPIRPDLAQLQVIRRNKIVVQCPGNPADPDWELTTPLPELGCANAFNLATQAANPRDLFVPRPFGGTDSTVAATAVRRLQEGKVRTNTVAINTDVSNSGSN
jgi:type IV pilus biogenesis protein CpaD/CtpE